ALVGAIDPEIDVLDDPNQVKNSRGKPVTSLEH
ncbi:unnamed protein product, partial [Rotaria sp. Silwood1]